MPLLTAVGLEEDYVKSLKAAYAQGGPAGAASHIGDAEIDKFSVVGDADSVTAKIERLARHGVTQVGILLNEGSAEASIAALTRIAREVMPRFR